MSSPAIDYAALAEQARGSKPVDYAALAKQARESHPTEKPGMPTEQPGVMERAISNIPSSAANALTHPTFPGMPTDVPASKSPWDELQKNKQNLIQGFKDLWNKPWDTVVNHVKEKFATDPVGTALAVAALAKPAVEHVAPNAIPSATAAVASIPGKVAEAAKAPGTMTIAKGATEGASGVAMLGSHPVVGGGLMVRGWQNIVKGMEERRAAQNAPPPIMEDLAQSLAGKAFDKLTPDAQAQIRQISEQVREPVRNSTQAQAPPPRMANGRIDTGPSETPGKTMAQMIQAEIDARKARNRPPVVDRPAPVWQQPNASPADIPQGPSDPTVAPQPRPISAAPEVPSAPAPERVPLWKGLPKPSEEKFGPAEGPQPRPQLPSGRRPPGQAPPETPQEAAPATTPGPDKPQSAEQGLQPGARVTWTINGETRTGNVIAKSPEEMGFGGKYDIRLDGKTGKGSVRSVDAKILNQEAQQFEGAYQIPAEERTGQVKAAPKESYQRAARTVKARALARWLRIGGISAEDAQSMTAEQWGMAAEGAGVNVPSPDSVKLALGELDKLYKAKGAVKIDEALKRGNQAEAHFYMDKAAKEPTE